MKKIVYTLTLLFIGTWAMAQSQPHAKIFSNFNYNLSQEENNFKAFEVNRAYLGYSHSLSDDFKAKVTFDVGNNSSGSAYTAFLKKILLFWILSGIGFLIVLNVMGFVQNILTFAIHYNRYGVIVSMLN